MQSKPLLEVIESAQGIKDLMSYLQDKEYIAYDTETTGLTKRDEIIGFSVCAEDDRAFYVILQKWNVETQSLEKLPTFEASKALIQSLQGKCLIGHNILFDCYMTEAYFKIRLIESVHTDTMILAHLLDENNKVGLKELCTRIFKDDSAKEQAEMELSVTSNGGTLTKAAYELYKADALLLAKYGAKDALLTYKLFYHLVPELIEQGLDKFFYEEESMPLLRGPTYELNTAGLAIDGNRLITLQKQLEAECMEAKAFIMSEIQAHIKAKYPGTSKKNHFNIGSSQQLAWLLFGELQLEYSTLTKAGKTVCRDIGLKIPYTGPAKRDFIASCLRQAGSTYMAPGNAKPKKIREPWCYIACDKATLQKLAPRYKWIAKLLEYNKKMKLLSTYVEGIQERTHYGVIQPGFLQHGTTSGRYSSRNPNFQNLPREDKRIKECIVARPGNVFVGADYSQLEPRVFAFFSKDERLLEAFKGTDDFYSVIGMEVYDKYDCVPQKDGSPDAFAIKYKSLRDLSKVIALASTYGAMPHQLAPTTGKSIDDTADDIRKYFERFPKVAQMMIDSHSMAKKDGQVVNLFGRPRRIPDAKKINKIYGDLPHAELPYEARSILNLSVNFRIQSTAASIVNRAMIHVFNSLKCAGIDAKIALQVHDSIVIECKKENADDVLLLLQNSMETCTILEGVDLEAIPKVGGNLAVV